MGSTITAWRSRAVEDSVPKGIAMHSKSYENRVRRAARRQGYLLRKSRSRDPRAEHHGLYVLVADSRGNQIPGAQAPLSAFGRGEGMTLADIEHELGELGCMK